MNDDDATPTKEQRERFEQALMSIRANGGDYNAVRRYCSYAFPDGEALPPLDADPENIDPSDPTTSVELGRMYLGPTGEVFFVTSTAIGRDWLDDCHGDESETLNLTRSTPKCPDDPTIDPDALPVRVRYNVAGY